MRKEAIASPIVVRGWKPGRNKSKRNAAAFTALQITAISNMKTLKVTLQCGWIDSARQYCTGPKGVGHCPVLITDPASQSGTSPMEVKKHVHSGLVYSMLLAMTCRIALSFASLEGFALLAAFETTITLRQSETTLQDSASPRVIEKIEVRFYNSDEEDVDHEKELNSLLNS